MSLNCVNDLPPIVVNTEPVYDVPLCVNLQSTIHTMVWRDEVQKRFEHII